MEVVRRKMIGVRSKVWFAIGNNAIIGQGRRDLLISIDRYGSISAASRKMGISYRKAWSSIQAMEGCLGKRLIVRKRGGRGGGTTSLTEAAKDLIVKYDRVVGGLSEFVDHRFQHVVKEEAE
jgi:molybdate transport system regulatory protein